MILQTNNDLVSAIENSYVLQEKLTLSQRDAFILNALSIRTQGQNELLELLKKEKSEIDSYGVTREKNRKIQFQNALKKLISDFKQKAKYAEEKNDEEVLHEIENQLNRL